MFSYVRNNLLESNVTLSKPFRIFVGITKVQLETKIHIWMYHNYLDLL